MSRENPIDHVSLFDEESTDAKKEIDDIDNKFDEARVAESVNGRGKFTFHIWILGLIQGGAFFEIYIAKLNPSLYFKILHDFSLSHT